MKKRGGGRIRGLTTKIKRGKKRGQFTRTVDWKKRSFFSSELGSFWAGPLLKRKENDSRDGTGPISHPISFVSQSSFSCVYGSCDSSLAAHTPYTRFHEEPPGPFQKKKQKKLGNPYPLLGYYFYSYNIRCCAQAVKKKALYAYFNCYHIRLRFLLGGEKKKKKGSLNIH